MDIEKPVEDVEEVAQHPGVNFEDHRGVVCWRMPTVHEIASRLRTLATQLGAANGGR